MFQLLAHPCRAFSGGGRVAVRHTLRQGTAALDWNRKHGRADTSGTGRLPSKWPEQNI
jgi:hypothetical protein